MKLAPRGAVRLDDRQKSLSFAAATLLFLILHQAYDIKDFPYDSLPYWQLSQWEALANFPNSIRGYFYPALLAPAHLLPENLFGIAKAGYRILTALAYGFALTIVLPSFFVSVFGGKPTVGRRLFVPLVVAAFWPGVILYPLSDLPALLLLVGSIAAIMKSREAATSRTRLVSYLLLAGLLLGGAYNTRPIYLFPLVCLTLALPWMGFGSAAARLAAVASLVAGMGLASLPQTLINLRHHGVLTPAVISQIEGSNKSLFASQLMWGITMQRYETSLQKTVPAPCVNYADPAGMALLELARIDKKNFDLSAYVDLVITYPFDFIGIYGRHLMNGLDLRDSEVYITEASSTRTARSTLNFTVLLAGLWLLLHAGIGTGHGQAGAAAGHAPVARAAVGLSDSKPFWLLVILLPVIAILPGAVETRFFLPLHLVLYGATAFLWSRTALQQRFLSRPVWTLSGLLGALTLFLSITLSTMSSMRYVCLDLTA